MDRFAVSQVEGLFTSNRGGPAETGTKTERKLRAQRTPDRSAMEWNKERGRLLCSVSDDFRGTK